MFKKSQVTIFIIIVLVILVMTSMTYYIIGARTTQEGEEKITIQQIGAAKIDPLKDYVESCLSLATSEGLDLIGKQGGYIYKSQGGTIPDLPPGEIGFTFIDYENTLVQYGIHRPISDVGVLFFAETPKYPWPTFPKVYHPITGDLVYDNYFQGFYGSNKMPVLLKPRQNSIEGQLEEFTKNSIFKCTDWTSFYQQGLNVSAGEINVSITFGDADVIFNIDWPLEITDLATGAVTDLNEFIAVYPVRFKRILNFTFQVTDADSNHIDYDIQASDGLLTSYKTESIFGNDDIITIRDSESTVFGEQFEFRFVRQNRPPALIYVENITEEVCNGSTVKLIPPSILSVDDYCGSNSYVINFTAMDPDEDLINFSTLQELPHIISSGEAGFGGYKITVEASDGQYKDWQDISIPVRLS